MRSPDQFGTAGKAWHLKRLKKRNKSGYLAVSIVALPGGCDIGSWFIVILREIRANQKFMPTSHPECNTGFEFIIGVLRIQPIKITSSLDNYSSTNPVVILTAFPFLEAEHLIKIYDVAISILLNGYLAPDPKHSYEWSLYLNAMAQQLLLESVVGSSSDDLKKYLIPLLPTF